MRENLGSSLINYNILITLFNCYHVVIKLLSEILDFDIRKNELMCIILII